MQIIPVPIKNEIEFGDNLSEMIAGSSDLQNGDVLVIAQKIISKQEGKTVELNSVVPSLLAQGLGSQYQKDSRVIELILSESKRIVRMQRGIMIVETHHGFVCANAGIDESNVRNGFATLLPVDPDSSADKIRKKIHDLTGKSVAVIISDTFGRPFRMGQTNCAIGISGLYPIIDYAGTLDAFGRELRVTAIAVADELSSATEMVMGKTLQCPAAIVRGFSHVPGKSDGTISDLLRSDSDDLFR